MSARSIRALLRLYPRGWRERYGEELAAAIVQAGSEGASGIHLGLDVAAAGVAERLRSAGLIGDGLDREGRARGGLLLVLAAWVLFAVGGIGVEKASEHWAGAVGASVRDLPRAAFETFFVAAALTSLGVLAGVALTAASLRGFIRAGGLPAIRRPLSVAVVLTVAAGVALVPLALWAHRLTNAQRNGHDAAYTAGFLGWVAVFLAGLAAWTVAALVTARRLELGRRLLELESGLAVAVSGSMVLMTAATCVWWGAVARSAPWFLAGTRAGSGGTVAPANLVLPALLMLVASVLGVAGAARARRNLRAAAGVEL